MQAIDVVAASGDELGEGPVWDARTRRLLRVDILAGRVLSLDPGTGGQEVVLELKPPIAFVLPRASDGLVVGQGRRVLAVDGASRVTPLVAVEPGRPANRFNDAACDAAGRLWAGTMSTVREEGAAALYRVDPDGTCQRVLERVTISNGLGWSPDGERLHHVDSPTQRIDVHDFDAATGTLTNRRTFAAIDPADGLPDGLTIDCEGGVWVALYGGGAIRRYTPVGALDAVIRTPVAYPTSLAFGGDRLDELFVTSACHPLSPDERRGAPSAGAVLRLQPGVRGRAPLQFAG